jgi:hypothetical protein
MNALFKKLNMYKQHLGHNNLYFTYLKHKIKNAYYGIQYKRYPDEEFIRISYKRLTGRDIDLINPRRYTEKLNWLKINYRNPDMPICSDKLAVRDYIIARGYKHLLNDLLFVFDDADKINLNMLPDRFVLKAAHGSGWNLICSDKKEFEKDWNSHKRLIKLWLKSNLYYSTREWVYKNQRPTIVCEKYLEDRSGSLMDYKIFCFDGKPKLIQVDLDRFNNRKQNFYNEKWELLNLYANGPQFDMSKYKPDNLNEMLEISNILSKEFPHVRVDLYSVNSKIYFGEFTFFDGSGYYSFDPDSFDFTLGDYLHLPEKNNFN